MPIFLPGLLQTQGISLIAKTEQKTSQAEKVFLPAQSHGDAGLAAFRRLLFTLHFNPLESFFGDRPKTPTPAVPPAPNLWREKKTAGLTIFGPIFDAFCQREESEFLTGL